VFCFTESSTLIKDYYQKISIKFHLYLNTFGLGKKNRFSPAKRPRPSFHRTFVEGLSLSKKNESGLIKKCRPHRIVNKEIQD
jgi:hypothetical protein